MNAIVIEGKEYHFKMAHPENTEEILSLYQSVMGTEGCTWDETYPSRETIAKDFANQALFIIEDNAHKIAGAISIDEDTEVMDNTAGDIGEKSPKLYLESKGWIGGTGEFAQYLFSKDNRTFTIGVEDSIKFVSLIKITPFLCLFSEWGGTL